VLQNLCERKEVVIGVVIGVSMTLAVIYARADCSCFSERWERINLLATEKETCSIILPVQMPVHFSKQNNTMSFYAVLGICLRKIYLKCQSSMPV